MAGKAKIPTPIGNGWELDENGSIHIKWNNVNSALTEAEKLIFCTCPAKRVRAAWPLLIMVFHIQADTFVKEECENYVFRNSDIDDIESDYLLFGEENN